MPEDRHEIEMRIDGLDAPARFRQVEEAIRSLDPGAQTRLEPSTGILHATTTSDTLDVVAALSDVGITANAMTG